MNYLEKELDGFKVNYIDEGQGIPVFFIPPWGSSSYAFEGVKRLLLKDGVRVIAINLPGWGKVSRPLLENKSFESYVQLISKFINSFGFKEYSILGYSLGVTFILGGIKMKLIDPTKVVLISGFHSRSNIFETESKLKNNVRILDNVRKFHIPLSFLKVCIQLVYFIELLSESLYRSKAGYYVKLIFFDAMRGDLQSAIGPIYSLPDHSREDFKHYRGRALVVYNVNEPWYFKQFTKEIAEMFSVEPAIIEAYSHRHLSFEPEKSYNVVKDFILD